MLPKPDQCKPCPLYQNGLGIVYDEIHDEALVQIHAQGPGVDEEREGRPKCGATGKLEEAKFFPLANLTRDQVSLSNAIRCRWIKDGHATNELPPPKVLQQAMEHCQSAHFRVGASTKLIVAQGNPAWQSLGGVGAVTEWSGFTIAY